MKTLIAILIIMFVGCGQEKNEKETIDWIARAKKPITCKLYGSNELGTKWTLIDSCGNVYQTGFVCLALPEKIR